MTFVHLPGSVAGAATGDAALSSLVSGGFQQQLTIAVADIAPATSQQLVADFVQKVPDLLTEFQTQVPPDIVTIISTIALVTASDMVPFVPCQPLAIALGSKFGPWAFPMCVAGQSLAGIIAFLSARVATNNNLDFVNDALDSLTPEASEKFQEFRQLGSSSEDDESNEIAVLLALIGLRLAPFFPFSAGNYLLGGATGVGLRPFVIATIFGCLLSNFLSVAIGVGGAAVYSL